MTRAAKFNHGLRVALLAAGILGAAPVFAQVTFYEREAFEGGALTAQKQVWNLERSGLRARASSIVVVRDRWEVCDEARFEGQCKVLRPGRYPTLATMGLADRVASVRMVPTDARVEDNRYAPTPWVARDYRRRNQERVYEAEVIAVRAVVGPPEQRCWVEHGQAVQDRNEGNILGGVTGAVIGGILGHQVGGGRGKDLATVGGAVAGGAVGMNIARDRQGQPAYTQDVQRCKEVPSRAEPEYWDVTYAFRGREHQVQMATRPGTTVKVNEQGEPRA
jgi:uncharacterized protein YcfJ